MFKCHRQATAVTIKYRRRLGKYLTKEIGASTTELLHQYFRPSSRLSSSHEAIQAFLLMGETSAVGALATASRGPCGGLWPLGLLREIVGPPLGNWGLGAGLRALEAWPPKELWDFSLLLSLSFILGHDRTLLP